MGKGHVPEENLTLYRKYIGISQELDRMGNSLSNIGAYTDANKLWRMSGEWKNRANDLRVDI